MSTEPIHKHTAGPWAVSQGDDGDPRRWLVVADSDRAWYVATVENGRPGDTLETERHTALLLAAAPELLAACQTFAAWLAREDAGFPDRDQRDTPEGEELWRTWYAENLRLCAAAQTQARAAIAKAYGRTAPSIPVHGQKGDVQYEYRTTEGPRKAWDGEPDLSKEGWEEYDPWARFDYHEERYWRRPLPIPIPDRETEGTCEGCGAREGERYTSDDVWVCAACYQACPPQSAPVLAGPDQPPEYITQRIRRAADGVIAGSTTPDDDTIAWLARAYDRVVAEAERKRSVYEDFEREIAVLSETNKALETQLKAAEEAKRAASTRICAIVDALAEGMSLHDETTPIGLVLRAVGADAGLSPTPEPTHG